MGQAPSKELTQLCGTIEKVVYKSAESGFSVFSLKVSSSETVMAKGCLPEVFQGEEVFLSGTWGFHPKFGRQFDVQECQAKAPSSVLGIRKYLASGLIKGIGPKFAERIVAVFGERTLDIIDKQSHRLLEVEGIGNGRADIISKAWQDQKEISKVMLFLRERDVSASFAVKIFKTYGNKAIELIQANPYRLVEDIWGIGFKSADQIALKLGLKPDSLDRIKAGIIHIITSATGDGHLYVVVEELKKEVITLLDLSVKTSAGSSAVNCYELINKALFDLHTQDKVKLITYQEKHYLTLPQFYYSEKGIAQKIQKLLSYRDELLSPDRTPIDIDEIYQKLRAGQVNASASANNLENNKNNIFLNEDQQRGIIACLQSKITIITGGPGTGKTTLIKQLLEVFDGQRLRYRLAAPTGRAAKRMFESTGRNTETLHRLLEFTPGFMSFARNEQNALSLDYLVVDEASMIDVFLMHSILKALPERGRLVLIGDIDQLPSVGAGNVLKDLIMSEKVAVIRLAQVFRQAQDSMIIVNAHNINKGEFPVSAGPESKRDFFYLKQQEPEEFFPLLHTIYKKRFPALGIHPDNTVVLVPMNRGTIGTQRINQELQMILNPEKPGEKTVSRFGQVYRIGDRVMQIRNNYEKFVFNGDMGKIKEIDQEDQKILIEFGERTLDYDFSELNELTLSYAISIHKSQGSEFDAVIIPIFMQHFILLQRNLIYTAITRAKKLCILVGQSKAIAMGIKNGKGVTRLTFLKEFLTTDLQAR
ncbi:MAG: ATP-dependent RecD-like DNA helicase [bacterium]